MCGEKGVIGRDERHVEISQRKNISWNEIRNVDQGQKENKGEAKRRDMAAELIGKPDTLCSLRNSFVFWGVGHHPH